MVYRFHNVFGVCMVPAMVAALLSGCVMGSPEQSADPMDPRMHEPIELDLFYDHLPGEGDESDPKVVYTDGKADNPEVPTKEVDDSPEPSSNNVDGDGTECWNEAEFDADRLPGEACTPANDDQGHGSPQPLDPSDPDDEDDTNSDESDES